jgi:hypothetical protein
MIVTTAGTSTSTTMYVFALALALTPVTAQLANTFKYVGLSGVSAQQMFLGTKNKVYIIDKTGMQCFPPHTYTYGDIALAWKKEEGRVSALKPDCRTQ